MSSRLRKLKSNLSFRLSRSCMSLSAIFPTSSRDQDETRLCGIRIPFLTSHMNTGRRHGARTLKRKNRDATYWQRVYEYPNLNDEERLLAHLKGIDGLPWKEIVVKFNEKMGLEMRQPALQMRLTRLAVRMDRLWTQENLQKVQEFTSLNPQTIHSTYTTTDRSYPRNKSSCPQTVYTPIGTAPISGLRPWSGMSENSNYLLSNPSPMSLLDNSLYYENKIGQNSNFGH